MYPLFQNYQYYNETSDVYLLSHVKYMANENIYLVYLYYKEAKIWKSSV